MNWTDIASEDFPEAIESSESVCLVPLGCIERHGKHLPLGTDVFIAIELCQRVAKSESVVVFPEIPFGQILEAMHCPGTIALRPKLIVEMLENICTEISRNGFKKIVFVNAHGGNTHLLKFFSQCQLQERRDYVTFLPGFGVLPEDKEQLKALWSSDVDGHAGEKETSEMLVIRPELVNMSAAGGLEDGLPYGRLQALKDAGVYTGIWWYADHPTHYRGQAVFGDSEKGEKALSARTKALVNAVRTIKTDQYASSLQDQFFDECENIGE